MNNNPSEHDHDRLVHHLEQIHLDVVEGVDSAEAINPRLKTARSLFELIERVRIHESANSTPGVCGLSDTDPENRRAAWNWIPAHLADGDDAGANTTESIGRFEVIRQIGQGGYGLVFLAYDPQLQRDVALKVPRPEAILTEQMRARFMREAKAAAILSHPNIVPVYEIGEFGPVCYIISQYIHGQTLSDWLESQGGLVSPSDATAIATSLADAVQHAHSRGILHRDLKPSNILFRDSQNENAALEQHAGQRPVPMITDFGLAKLASDDSEVTRRGDILGTPGFMAPEQAGGEAETGPASDIYSLGAIIYRLLTGRKPHERDSVAATLQAVREVDPDSPRKYVPNLPRDLEAICMKCLERLPSNRYQSAYELTRDLEAFSEGRPVAARNITPVGRLTKWWRRNPALATTLTTLGVVLVAGLITVSMFWLHSNRLYVRAEHLRIDAETTVENLQGAVDEMLLALANMPEIETAGFEPVRLRLLERANGYYESFSQNQPDDPDIRRTRSATLLKLARVKSKLGDFSGAASLSNEFLKTQRTPEESTPEEIQLRIDALVFLANSSTRTGIGDPVEQIQRALALARSPIARIDDEHQARIDLAMSLTNAANVFGSIGNRTRSLEHINESIELWEQVDWNQLENEETRNELGATYLTAALSNAQAETRTDGIKYCRKAIDFYENLAEQDSASDNMLYALARAHRIMSWYLGKDLAAAQQSTDRAEEILIDLAARHPLVPRYQMLLMGVRYAQGMSFYFARQYDPAGEIFDANIQLGEELLIKFPEDPAPTLGRLADNLTMLGLIRKRQGNLEGRLEVLLRSESINRQRFEESNESNQAAVALSGVEAEIAKCFLEQDRLDEALARIIVSNERLAKLTLADPDNGEAKRFLVNGLGQKSDILAARGEYGLAIQAVEETLARNSGQNRHLHMNRLVKFNLALRRYDEALTQARGLVEYCSTRSLANAMLPLFNDHLELLDHQIAEPETDEPANAAARDELSELAVQMLELIWESGDDASPQLQDIDNDPRISLLRESDAFIKWRQSR